MATSDRDDWLEDFSLVLQPKAILRLRRNPEFEYFAGSKYFALPWLAIVAAIFGALGGLLVSGSLWRHWYLVLAWLPVAALVLAATLWLTRAMVAGPLMFLSGWCMFFGLCIGVFAMWGAQTASTGWCYAIAGGLTFFLVGITGGDLRPPNSKPMEDWFMTSALAAPASCCLAAWTYRNLIDEPETLLAAAFTGALAALPFLTVTAGLYLLAWRPERGLGRLAALYLHNDRFAGEAVRLFNSAKLEESAIALARRGLAYALAGDRAAAEGDWAKARELEPHSREPDLARGWAELRQNDPATAARSFGSAARGARPDPRALIGLGIAQLQAGDPGAALATLNRVQGEAHGALSLTYLAEAYLRTGDPASAVSVATDAIEETDSIHGRTWLVRAEAHRALGQIDEAASDYNRALWAADELGIDRRARKGLREIDRPVTDEEPECC
jgi:tetratricopeptide (TPR) repeat protein